MDNRQKEDFLIPIDDAIEAFRYHLDAHDRTILSARFGDGKSFFLSHFMEKEDVAECYTFLTIFPVNYQVVENRDIFELIKRDILLQMLLKGVIEIEVEINDELALALYLQNQLIDFVESFLPLLSELAMNGDEAKTVATSLVVKKFFKSIKQKLEKIKKQFRDNRLDDFLNAVEKHPVVGQDAISNIIQQCLQQYREKNPNKRVVLVIEDLDRIDPAHLFRIMNIFSAHVDFCYRQGCKPDASLAANKFGLDKVVFVMDYENVRHIYSHFYGKETNFDGYIEKFCSSNYFAYSLAEQRESFFVEQISKEIEIPKSVLNYLVMPEDFNKISIRRFAQAIEDIDGSIINIPKVKNHNNIMVSFHPGILRLIVILRKLGVKDDVILSRIKNSLTIKDSERSGVFSYLAQYLTLLSYRNSLSTLKYSSSAMKTNFVHVNDIDEAGKAVCSFSYSFDEDKNTDRGKFAKTDREIAQVCGKMKFSKPSVY